MSRRAAVAARERQYAAAARVPANPSPALKRQALRRLRFIREHGLSLSEAVALASDFDPGPEYDFPTCQEPAL